MSSAPAPTPSPAPDSRPRTGGAALALWSVSAVVVVLLAAAGIFSRQPRTPPLPVIAEVPAFALTHRDGSTVTRDDLAGNPWIADFIFTRCAAICPRMTAQMGKVEKALGEGSPVRIASFSVDPQHDTPEVLDRYATAHGAGKGWYFLTGEAQAIHSLCRDGFLLAAGPASPADLATGNDPVIHSNRFVLVDATQHIRGYYDPFEPGELDRLLGDVRRLLAES